MNGDTMALIWRYMNESAERRRTTYVRLRYSEANSAMLNEFHLFSLLSLTGVRLSVEAILRGGKYEI